MTAKPLEYATPGAAARALSVAPPAYPVHIYDNSRGMNVCLGVVVVIAAASQAGRSSWATAGLLLTFGAVHFAFAFIKRRPAATFTADAVKIRQGRDVCTLPRRNLVAFQERRNGVDLVLGSGESVRLGYFGLTRSSIERLRALMPSYIQPREHPASTASM